MTQPYKKMQYGLEGNECFDREVPSPEEEMIRREEEEARSKIDPIAQEEDIDPIIEAQIERQKWLRREAANKRLTYTESTVLLYLLVFRLEPPHAARMLGMSYGDFRTHKTNALGKLYRRKRE